MAGMLELSDREFKTPMINVLRALMGKIDSMQEQMSNVSREMDILGKNQKKMLEIKNTATEMKTASDGLTSRLDMVEERISELEDTSIQSSKPKKQREQRLGGKKEHYSRTVEQWQKM